MGRSLAILGVPGVLDGGGAADTSFSMTVTTTGAQTLTIQDLTVSASTTVDWGDGSSNDYTGSGTRAHNYAGAGTWKVTIKQPLNVTLIDLRDTKITNLPGLSVSRLVNLTSLRLSGIDTALVWTVNDAAPMPSKITYLYLHSLPNLTWNVGSVAGANMPSNIAYLYLLTLANLTWNVGSVAGANMPSNITYLNLQSLPNLTWNVGSVAGANMPANATSVTIVGTGTVTIEATDILPAPMTTFRFENNLNRAAVDAVLAALYLAFPTRTGTAGTIDLLGTGNAAPTGVSPGSAECPPTTGWNTAHELVNDSCGVSAKHWASVALQT